MALRALDWVAMVGVVLVLADIVLEVLFTMFEVLLRPVDEVVVLLVVIEDTVGVVARLIRVLLISFVFVVLRAIEFSVRIAASATLMPMQIIFLLKEIFQKNFNKKTAKCSF